MKPGELPTEIRTAVNKWLDLRDWNFSRGYFGAGLACAENAKNVLVRYFRRNGIA